MNIILACGGTGGHIFPALSAAEYLKKQDPQGRILLVASRRPQDIKILGRASFESAYLPVGSLGQAPSLKYIASIFRLAYSFIISLGLIRRFKPDVIVGFGGYISGPVLLAGFFMRKPIVLHEQNIAAGLTNRILSVCAKKIALHVKETKGLGRGEKVVVTGNPVRAHIFQAERSASRAEFALDPQRITVLVVGGSQGSFSMNTMVLSAFQNLGIEERQALQVIHLTGEADYERVCESYRSLGMRQSTHAFYDEMGKAYAASDFVIARAGATTIAEIAALGLPAILIPYPHSGGHQRFNAQWLAAGGGAMVIEQAPKNIPELVEAIRKLLGDAGARKAMALAAARAGRRDSAERLSAVIREAARQ